jgi:hypothetical protein
LSRLFIALAALFALRLLFAPLGANNRAGSPRPPAPPLPDDRQRGSDPSRAPRIDASLAEDVPFVEVGRERESVRRD